MINEVIYPHNQTKLVYKTSRDNSCFYPVLQLICFMEQMPS